MHKDRTGLRLDGHAVLHEALRAQFTTSRDLTTLSLKTLDAYAATTGDARVKSLVESGEAKSWVAGRQLIDLIDRFPAALSAEQLRALTRPLAPRAYSIASSRGEVGEEAIKEASRYLRGTLAEGLAEAITGAVIEDDQQLVKFHGMYLQDDRDLRAERRRKKMEAAFAFMIRVPWPLRRSQRRYSAQAAVFANLCAPAKSRSAPSWASANSAASGSLRARNLAAAARCSRGSVNTITFAAGLGGSSMDVPNQQSCAIGLAA